MAEVETTHRRAGDNNVPERVEGANAPARELSADALGRAGDLSVLQAMNTHTHGALTGRQLELPDPYKAAGADAGALPAAGQRPGAGPVEEVAGRPRNGGGRTDIPEALRPFLAPPTDPKVLEQGVVKITPTFPGTGRFVLDGSADGSGFLVNTKGDRGPSKPGEQYIATADHVIEDRMGKVYQLGANLFQNQPELSKDALRSRGNEVLAGIDDKKPHGIFNSNRDYARDELSYLVGNFDGIQKVSKELSPGAKGITLDGLEEFRRRNTKIDIETAAGHFQAQIANRDPNSDVAILKIGGLTPEQQRKLGSNIEFETTPLQMDQSVKSIGFKRTVDSKIDGVDRLSDLGDRVDSVVVDKPLEKGMSGGPTFAESFKAVGINHATDSKNGYFIPITDAKPLLKEIAEGKVRFRRALD